MFHRSRIPALLLLAAVLSLLPAISSADRFKARELAREAMEAYNQNGYSVRDIQIGVLIPGDPYYLDTQMTAGNEYVVATGGDENLRLAGILVYDENWMPVAKSELGKTAEVVYKAKWTGAYHVKLYWMDNEKDKEPAYWYIVSGYK